MENNIEDDIKNAEHFIDSIKTDKEYKEENGWHGYYNKEIVELTRILEHILSDYKRVLKENENLKNEIMEKDLEIIGKEEYTKASMKEIIAQYYTSNEDCIPKSKIKDIIDRIDYDIKKTKEIIAKNTNVHATYRKNEYQIVRLRAMNTKSLDIKKRLQKLLENEEK
ncbi:unknown [Clostridium sp. CAG:269]|nr:unknown [Clostridium sp. CAG:269]